MIRSSFVWNKDDLICMKQCVPWNTIAVKPSEKAVNSRVCESKLHGKSICLFLWGLMSCGFSSRQNDYSCTVYQKWESWPCLVTFYCSWNDAHNGDLWRYQVWYVFLRISFYKLIFEKWHRVKCLKIFLRLKDFFKIFEM